MCFGGSRHKAGCYFHKFNSPCDDFSVDCHTCSLIRRRGKRTFMGLRHKTIDRYTFGTVYTIYHGNSLVQSLAGPDPTPGGRAWSIVQSAHRRLTNCLPTATVFDHTSGVQGARSYHNHSFLSHPPIICGVIDNTVRPYCIIYCIIYGGVLGVLLITGLRWTGLDWTHKMSEIS